MDSHSRTLAKTLSWRISATVVTTTLVWLFTKNLPVAVGIGGAEAISKTILFYVHERVWVRIHWGREK